MNTTPKVVLTPSDLLVLGHRGAAFARAPFFQNSLGAFQEAVDAADGFETDACVDGDGAIFLIHEAKYVDPAKGVEYCMAEYLDAASAAFLGGRRVDQLTTDDMRRLRLKDGAPIPTLKEAIEIVGARLGKLLNIELKAHDVAGPVLRLVKDCIQRDVIASQSLLVSSFNHPSLEIVRREAPELGVGAIFVGADQPTTPLFPWRPGSPGAYTALTPEALEDPILKKVVPDYFIMPEDVLTPETVAMIAAQYPKAKCVAWVFTEKGNFNLPNLLARLEKLRSTGKVAAMIVDNPREFVKALRG